MMLILKSFKAKNVHGYLNFDFDLNSDLNFLVGGNGSGKTTALKLINGLLTPNFEALIFIPFKVASLEIEHENKSLIISATLIDSNIELTVNSLEEKIILPSSVDTELEYISHKDHAREDFIEDINRKYRDSILVEKLSEIPSPIFLGLDRRKEHINNEKNSEYFTERERWMSMKYKRRSKISRFIKGSVGISLMETEFLVQDAYRRLRQLEDKHSTKLRDSILLSAFHYAEYSFEEESFENSFLKNKELFFQRQKEIKEALSKIGINDDRLSYQVDIFFEKLGLLFESKPSEDSQGINIEILTNKAQIDRISKIVDIIDEYKSKVDKLFKPISEFIEVVNEFYSDSHKTLAVNTVGQLVVERPDGKKCTIDGLSSGERQLLVIFAHIFFGHYNNKSSVYIIDEPELSLHLRWQEKFSKTILDASPKSQFLMATHSPEIIGENKNKAIKCK